MIHSPKRLFFNRRNQPRVDFLYRCPAERRRKFIDRNDPRCPGGVGFVSARFVSPIIGPTGYGGVQWRDTRWLAWWRTYIGRCESPHCGMRDRLSAYCPVLSARLFPSCSPFLFLPFLSACPSLYPSLSATQRSSFVANLRRDSQLEAIAMRACQIRIAFAHHGGSTPVDPINSTIRS